MVNRKPAGVKKIIGFILISIIIVTGLPAQAAEEVPEAVYYGDTQAGAVIANLDYNDVKGVNIWSKPAIYEAAALGIIKGLRNMDRRFGRTDVLTREEALSLVYRAAGREAEAQIQGEALNNIRADKKIDVLEVWYDGFLQLAAADGLITRQNLRDAMEEDQSSLEPAAFRRNGAVSRQEMAFWLARVLNLQPVRGQQNIFNNYLDWRSADPDKVPYIEAVLQNKIMNGDGNGRFNPTSPVTREQAAQIIKNAEAFILDALLYEKQSGIIEKISIAGDYSTGTNLSVKNIDIRNSTGSLHRITGLYAPAGKNENSGNDIQQARELVVYKNGNIGNSTLLAEGDRIEYITGATDGTVKYINVLSNANTERYVAAQIRSVDHANRLLSVMQFFAMDFPDPALLRQNVSFDMGSESRNITYRYSANTVFTVNGAKKSLEELTADATVILTINQGNIVTAIQSADFGLDDEESRIVKGIVEEVNPELGYITLYNEDGTGTGANASAQLAVLRTYSYINQNALEVFRNHATASVEDIQVGDSAFLKLDDDGNVISISAVDNYSVKYGKVISKMPGAIAVEYRDGTQQILEVGNDVLFIRDKKLVSYNSLKDGDRVKLLLNITNKGTDLKEVTIEDDIHFITNIYKGEVSYIDETSDKLVLLNLQVFRNGTWQRTDRKGFTSIPLSEGYRLQAGNLSMDIGRVNKLLSGNEAYIAVEKDYGGEEKAVLVSFRYADDSEIRYTDKISGAIPGSDSFRLSRENRSILYDAGSIVVRHGRLVTGSSLASDDKVHVVANRSYGTGDYTAGVVWVEAPEDNESIKVYRVRIREIDDNTSFTAESFSLLSGTDWEYYNTQKTFNLTFNTRLLGDDGVISIRDFKAYGDDSYLNRVVYVVSDGTNALLVSTAPYGTVNAKGKVYEISGAEFGEEGTLMREPDSLRLHSVKIYDNDSYVWKDAGEMRVNILSNTVIIKAGKIIKPSELQNGDTLRIIKKDTGLTGDAYIIFVEN